MPLDGSGSCDASLAVKVNFCIKSSDKKLHHNESLDDCKKRKRKYRMGNLKYCHRNGKNK